MTDAWKDYEGRMELIGKTKREMIVNHTRESLRRRLVDSAACHEVLMDGVPQLIAIAHHDELYTKKIRSLPGEHLHHGGIVDYSGSKWLITEFDADNEIYEKGIMRQCNHVLRWTNQDGLLREKWCVVEDGTKYLIGEKSSEIMTIGDSRMAVTIGKDDETIELCRGLRFLIDDTDSTAVTAYQITKSNKLFNVFNGEGVFRFILNEVQLTEHDNTELRIADFNNWRSYMQIDSRDTDGVAELSQPYEGKIPLSDGGWL